jgi:hypothetical protein
MFEKSGICKTLLSEERRFFIIIPHYRTFLSRKGKGFFDGGAFLQKSTDDPGGM